MVVHVAVRAKMCQSLDQVIVCTDSEEIADVCKRFEIDSCMTQSHHQTGTDRIGEAVKNLGLAANSVIVDIQGDEPLINPHTIDQLITKFTSSKYDIMLPYLEFNERSNINIVKLVERQGRIIFMSREDIPSCAFKSVPLKKHLSIVAFRITALEKFCNLPASELEKIENVELLRAIENDISIGTFAVDHESFSVDVQSDLDRANQIMPIDPLYQQYVKSLQDSSL